MRSSPDGTMGSGPSDEPVGPSAGPAAGGPTVAGADRPERRKGAIYGLAAYLLWGSFPLYIRALAPASPVEILAERILWSLACCAVLLARVRGLPRLWSKLRTGRTFGRVALAGTLITINWTTYLVAVTSGHITEAALGYFLNPLVSVALGLVVLGERLRRLQAVAVAIGVVAAVVLAVEAHSLPVIPLLLAFSFGSYGLAKNRLGAHLTAVESLTAETAVLAPAAAVVVAVLAARSETTFLGYGAPHAVLLASTGLMTAVPLLLFAAAARRVPLVTIGLLQFIAPVLQLLSALVVGETVSRGRWLGFAIVWLALGVLVVDMLRQGLRGRRSATRISSAPR